VLVLVEGEGLDRRRDELARLETRLAEEPGVAFTVGPARLEEPRGGPPFVSPDGRAAWLAAVLDREPLSADAIERVRELEEALPGLARAAGLTGVRTALAGDTALARGTVDGIVNDLKRIGLVALAVNLVLLALFLRALVAPVYLLLASLLAVCAALGLTTLLFQELLGHGDLTYWVPFAVAVLLLSLGSDYNLFVVGRIWQEARRRPLRDAIVVAAPRASRTITVAGLALAGSFALLAFVPLRAFREFAFAMAVGILLDTFVLRPVLVPALVSLFGEAGWWPGTRRRFEEAFESVRPRALFLRRGRSVESSPEPRSPLVATLRLRRRLRREARRSAVR
jgi:RND superfamily putative drug exporter